MREGGDIVVGEAAQAEWDAFVARRPDHSGYHFSAWRRVFERAFGHETAYLAARRHGDLVGVLPLVLFRTGIFGRFVSSLPFVNYGGVLALDEAAGDALLEAATDLARTRRMEYIELRHEARRFPILPARSHKVAMILPLPSTADDFWTALDRKVRNQIRRAEKSGLTIVDGRAELVGEFYDVFAHNMRDLGTPVYSRRVFEAILDAVPGTSIHLVRLDGRAIAGAVAYAHGDTYEVPWASSLRSERPRCPNHLLYWHAIRRAIAARCTAFDFGRSTPGEGTYQFKLQWGAVARPVCWEYRLLARASVPNQSPTNPRYRAAIAVWKRLPVPVTRLLGPAIVRRIA